MLAGVAALTAALATGSASQQAAPAAPPSRAASSGAPVVAVPPERALLNRYCVSCHNEKLRTASLTLDVLDVGRVPDEAETWEKVIKKLRARQMPPLGAPRPSEADYGRLIAYLEEKLDAAAEAHPNPGRPADHRLNRAEYANAVRDLLGLEIDPVALLPADDASDGFDNLADVLSTSPLLMERYMLAAGKISRLAVGDAAMQPAGETYTLPQLLVQDDRTSDDLPFGSRGGIAVKHIFPADGQYTLRIKLQRNDDGYIRGLRDRHEIDVRVGGKRVATLSVGGEYKGRSGPIFSRNDPDYRGDPDQVAYEYSADENLEVRFNAAAGPQWVQVAFLKKTVKPEGIDEPKLVYADMGQYRGGNPAIESVTITGPFDARGISSTPSRKRIFTCYPAVASEERACAKQVVTQLARRAFRRPVSPEEVEDLLGIYEVGRGGRGFEGGIQAVLQRILAGPEFLFRVERDPEGIAPNTVFSVNDFELASRLSFFLWSSIPDDELLSVAEQGRLKETAVLEQQVRRMLADERADALVENFAGQWLSIRNMRLVSPDPDVYPEFDDNLREAFQQEMTLFFRSLLREDRSVLNLLDADYTFVNERLARHYGIPNVYGNHFRRVVLTDENRRGVFGKGSLLTVTSYGKRTSPVLRGKWVLENFLGTPPPPPPPNVPALEEKSKDGKALTMREQMEQHRANPACAVCHKLMDPIGFALENFDAIGKWRTVSPYGDASTPIDASGVFPDGTQFNGVVEFRKYLVAHPEQFLNTVTEKLLTYALGRRVDYRDAPAVRKILRSSASSGYRWSSLILGVVESTPFRMRRSHAS